MKASVIGRVKNTELRHNKSYFPLFEAVSNSFHAIEDTDRQSDSSIEIELTRNTGLLKENSEYFSSIAITDNGSGFNDVNFESFNTVDTQLRQTYGGKGLGRFIWLKAFDRVEIESHYFDGETLLRRRLEFHLSDEEIIADPVKSDRKEPSTTVRLIGFRSPYMENFSNDLEKVAVNLIKHFLPQILGPKVPQITLTDGEENININNYFKRNISKGVEKKEFKVNGSVLSFQGFKFYNSNEINHQIQYAAHNRGVISDRLNPFIPDLNAKIEDEDGNRFSYLALVEGRVLDENVNNERTNFNFLGPDDSSDQTTGQIDLFEEEISLSQIRKQVLELVSADLKPFLKEIIEQKKDAVNKYIEEEAPQYRHLRKSMKKFINKISPNSNSHDIEMVLHEQEYIQHKELKDAGRKLLKQTKPKQEIHEYEKEIQEFLKRYSELTESRQAAYVMQRRFILDILEKAITPDAETGKFPLESSIHNIIFPMHRTSDDIKYEQQNLWIVDERLTYHQFLGSDIPLSSIDSIESESGKRPDIIVFNKPLPFGESHETLESVAVIEFKRAARNDYDDDPVSQIYDAIDEIKAGKRNGPKGRPIPISGRNVPFYAYIICDLTPNLVKNVVKLGATPTPDREGYFGFNPHFNVFYEIISYDKLLRDAKKRNRVLFEKLSIPAEISLN